MALIRGDQITGSVYYALTSSLAEMAVTASYAFTASWAMGSQTAESASFAEVTSLAHTASLAISSQNSQLAETASYAETSSLSITASYAQTAQQADLAITSSYAETSSTSLHADSASYALSSSLAQQAATASYSLVAVSSSHADQADSSNLASTSSYSSFAATAQQSTSSSYSSTAVSSSWSVSASYSNASSTATYADSSGHAVSADSATNASTASLASTASVAIEAQTAHTASLAVSAISSQTSSLAQQAQYAVTASNALLLDGKPYGSLATTGSNTFLGDQDIQGNVTIHGTASIAYMHTLYQTASVIYGSGSTKFGDTLDDIHQFTGSLLLTQSGIQGVDYIDFTIAADPTHQEGRVHWYDDGKTLHIDTDVNGFMVEVGHQSVLRVANVTDPVIPKGAVVYVDGEQGNKPTIARADCTSELTSNQVIGIVASDIALNQRGYIVTSGIIRGLDTSGYHSGDILYLSASGAMSLDRPIPPNHAVSIGKVVTAGPDGIVVVSIQSGFELDELHDVLLDQGALNEGDLLIRSGSLWTNAQNLSGNYKLTGSLYGSATTSTTSSYSLTASLAVTSSYANYAASSSVSDQSISSSYSLTASYAINAGGIDTGSLVTTSSFNQFTSSYNTGSFKGTLEGTASIAIVAYTASIAFTSSWSSQSGYSVSSSEASHAISASYSITSSWALQAASSTSSSEASHAISASYSITSSWSSQSGYSVLSSEASHASTASYYLEYDPVFVAVSASLATTGSNTFHGDQVISGSVTISGSLNATSSYALQAWTASYVQIAQTASYVTASAVDGILRVIQGGTGHITFNVGDIFYADTTGSLARLAIGGANTVLHGGPSYPGYSQIVEADLSFSDNTTNNATTSSHGLMRKYTGNSSQYLDGAGNFSTPTGVVNSYGISSFTNQVSNIIVHNYGAYPVVQVIDSSGSVLIPKSIVNDSVNQFTVTFNSTTSGTVIYSVGAPQPNAYRAVNADYTLDVTDFCVEATTGTFNLTLPTAVGNTGRVFKLKNTGTGIITILTTSSQTIDGETSQYLTQYEGFTVMSNGTNYIITN